MNPSPRRTIAGALGVLALGCSAAPNVAPAAAPVVEAREEVTACGYIADHREGYRCLAALDASVRAHRVGVWMVHTLGGRVTLIEHQNSSGDPTADGTGVARHVFTYAAGHLATETTYAPSGRLIAKIAYAPDGTRSASRDAAGGWVADEATGAEVFVERRFDERGFLVDSHFQMHDGGPPEPDGPAEARLTRDEHGFIVGRTFFDPRGRPVAGEHGCIEERYEVDRFGNRLVSRCFDEHGGPALDRHRVHLIRRVFDDVGNLVEERYYGITAPTTADGKGVHRYLHRIDERGRAVERTSLGLDGAPHADALGIARTLYSFDDHGRVESELHFNAALAPIAGSTLGARVVYKRDGAGLVVERSYFDEADRLIGSHRIRLDDRELEVEVRCVDAAGLPRHCSGAAVGWRTEHDARRRIVARRFIDASGAVVENGEGVAETRTTYGPSGAKSEASFDAKGAPAVTELGAKQLVVLFAKPGEKGRTHEQAKQRAEEALAKIKKGMPFEDAVAAYTDEPGGKERKGNLGTFKRGAMAPAFEQIVAKLAVGQMSGVVESPVGFHVIVRTK